MAVPISPNISNLEHQFAGIQVPNASPMPLSMGYAKSTPELQPTTYKPGPQTTPTPVSAYPAPSSYVLPPHRRPPRA